MLDRTTPPPFHNTENIHLNPQKEFRLDNGIPFFCFENPQLDLIHLVIKIKAGALYEPQKRISNFCYNLLKESHPKKKGEAFEAYLDYYGTALNITAGINEITVKIQFPKNNAEAIIPEIAKLFVAPKYRKENLERYRAKNIKDWEYNARKVDFRASQFMFHHFFGKDFVFGKILEKSDFEAINLQQLEDYRRRSCCAENIRMFLAGNVDDALVGLIFTHFSQIQHGERTAALRYDNATYHPDRIHETWSDALQTAFVLCQPSPTFKDADIHRFRILNTLFCNYFGSRLMQNLRERNGYTYGIGGSPFYFDGGAVLSIDCEVNNKNAEAAIQACFDEMKRLQQEMVSDEELEIVRNYLFGSALRSIDGTVQYMQSYISWNDFGCNEERFYDYFETIKTISADDIHELANRYLREENFTVITVGNPNS